jgi:hypothetical protein
MVVVGELSHMYEVDPVILSVRGEDMEVCLEPLVVQLYLALGLGMVSRGQLLINTQRPM